MLFGQQNSLFNRVNIRFSEGSVEQYLDTIQHQLDVVFVYSNAVNPRDNVHLSAGIYTVSQVLDSIFVEQSVVYITRDNLIILSPQLESSRQQNKVVVSGQVVNNKRLPIPFATIFIQNKSLGTISNNEGKFRFVLPSSDALDTLRVSCLGYQDRYVLPDEYLMGEIRVKLEVSSIPLKEVIVRPEDPKFIVKEAYRLRKVNYPNNHLILNGFFREASKQDEDYISLSEALIEIKKSSYSSQINDLVKLVKGRNGKNTAKSEMVNLVVEGGLYNGMRLDVVKYESYFFGENMFKECDYSLQKRVFFNGRQTYVIAFKDKEAREYASYKGKLYIDTKTLALVRAEFELSNNGIKYARSLLVKKRPRGYKVKPIYARYVVEYRYYNNVWNLHQARSDMALKVRKVRGRENRGYSCVFTSTSEFVITGISTNPNKRIPFKAVSKSSDVLVEQVANTQGEFWTNENIILPEEPLQKTIDRLREQGEIPQ